MITSIQLQFSTQVSVSSSCVDETAPRWRHVDVQCVTACSHVAPAGEEQSFLNMGGMRRNLLSTDRPQNFLNMLWNDTQNCTNENKYKIILSSKQIEITNVTKILLKCNINPTKLNVGIRNLKAVRIQSYWWNEEITRASTYWVKKLQDGATNSWR